MLWFMAGAAQAQGLIEVQAPPRTPLQAPTPVVAGSLAEESLDCRMSEADYYQLRQELKEIRREEGSSIGVSAEGRQCEIALDTVIRNGPFLGVQRVEPGTTDLCTAVLRPGPSGYALDTMGDCRDDHAEMGYSGGASRIVSVGWWLPYGISARWNEDIGAGFSAVLDMGWQLPSSDSPFDLTANTNPTGPATTLRPMAGFDLAARQLTGIGLAGTYIGFRAGFEVPLVLDENPFDPELGLVSFLVGRKWVANNLAFQAGMGGVAEIPMLNVGPRPESVYPMVELRAGLANRR